MYAKYEVLVKHHINQTLRSNIRINIQNTDCAINSNELVAQSVNIFLKLLEA